MRATWAKRGMAALAGALVLAMAGIQPLAAQSKSDGFKFLQAVDKRDGDAVTVLLSQPGSTLVNARHVGTGQGALHIVTERRDLVWLKFLLSKGANPNVADKHGVTPIEIASRLGFVDGIEALIERGAEIDVATATGETPLISAVHRRDIPMIRLLVKKGANPDRTDNSGRSARDYAKLTGANSQVLDELERAESARGDAPKTYGPK